MKNSIIIIFLLKCVLGFSTNLVDTVKVTIDLRQVDSLGLKINVYPPSDLKGLVNYQFPKSIPGIYEYLNNYESIIELSQNGENINCVENSFRINCNLSQNKLTYSAKSTINRFKGISAEDAYYLKDSIFVLNWHWLLGFFKTETKRPYKITIIKNTDLLGTGSLSKNIKNDTTDIYIAENYKHLIHSPIMYSIPDTTTFRIGETIFTISYAGNDSLLNSKKIKDLLIMPLSELLKESHYKPKNYTFLFYSEYSLTVPYLSGLEHPNSTLICCHSALLNNNILVGSSIHEFIHAIYAPLRIRSEVINDFDFISPSCDEFLWFYEGITEYLSVKTLLDCGFFSQSNFLNELNESYKYYKNINFRKVSDNIYDKKKQKLFDNFYTKGSLFAFQLDVEIIILSNGKTDLFKVMQKLQKSYNPNVPFNSKSFIKEFSLISGVDLQDYILENTSKKNNVSFLETTEKIGFSQELKDTLIWSYTPKKDYLILNFKKNRLEYALIGSLINKKLNSKKVTIYEINDKPLTWFNSDIIMSPSDGKEVSFRAKIGKETLNFKIKPKHTLKEKQKINWIKNKNYELKLAKKYWGE